jgi:hypothetical protein
MTKEKYSSNVGIDEFFKLFEKRRTKYPKGYYLAEKHKKKNIPLDKPLFKSLVVSYFGFYFKDFYSKAEELYFPLSGKLMKTKGKGFYKNKNSCINTESVNMTWFERPALNYVRNIKLIKLSGSTSRLKKIEKEYKEMYDVGLLPATNKTLQELSKNNKLHAQW